MVLHKSRHTHYDLTYSIIWRPEQFNYVDKKFSYFEKSFRTGLTDIKGIYFESIYSNNTILLSISAAPNFAPNQVLDIVKGTMLKQISTNLTEAISRIYKGSWNFYDPHTNEIKTEYVYRFISYTKYFKEYLDYEKANIIKDLIEKKVEEEDTTLFNIKIYSNGLDLSLGIPLYLRPSFGIENIKGTSSYYIKGIMDDKKLKTKSTKTKGKSIQYQPLWQKGYEISFIDTPIIHKRQRPKLKNLLIEENYLDYVVVRSARQIELYDRTQIIQKLKNYPRVQRSLSAAFDRLQDISPDAARHCVVSCRVALEQFCMDAGKSSDWKKGLNNIYTSDTDRKHIKAVWNYLSGKGPHGGHDPDKAEAENSLKITIASLEAMLKKIKK